MGQDSAGSESSIQLETPAERGWWLRTRRPDDPVRVSFCLEAGEGTGGSAGPRLGPFRAIMAQHEGRMAAIQVFIQGVVGGYIVDIDTADGESRVIDPVRAELDHALGTSASGYFAVDTAQVAGNED